MPDKEAGYTVILVPSDTESTRRFAIRPRMLRVGAALGAAGAAVLAVVLASWWYFAIQAGRVPGLERDIAQLEGENARVEQLALALAQLQVEYEKIRTMMGTDAAEAEPEPGIMAPDEPEGTPTGARTTGLSPEIPTSWPLAAAGFVTQVHGGSNGGGAIAGQHPGLDIAVAQDSYILASGAGLVREAGSDSIYGLYVLIDHGNSGYSSMYGHASRLFVETGDAVRQNEVIALSGNTGRSTAPHLHFEIHQGGRPVDPLTLAQQQR